MFLYWPWYRCLVERQVVGRKFPNFLILIVHLKMMPILLCLSIVMIYTIPSLNEKTLPISLLLNIAMALLAILACISSEALPAFVTSCQLLQKMTPVERVNFISTSKQER